MSFDGTEGKFISLEEGGDLTTAWSNGDQGSMKGYFYGKEKLAELMTGKSEGIRVYFGQTMEGHPTLVLIGADSSENDIVTGKILDSGIPCPSICGVDNDLNS